MFLLWDSFSVGQQQVINYFTNVLSLYPGKKPLLSHYPLLKGGIFKYASGFLRFKASVRSVTLSNVSMNSHKPLAM